MTTRDAQRLTGIHPALVMAVREVFDDVMEKQGYPMFVVQGLRTTPEQAALYRLGRQIAGPNVRPGHSLGDIVTWKDGILYRSNHQVQADGYGHAVDCAFLPIRQRPNPFDPAWPWEIYGQAFEQRGMAWGARFLGLGDLD